MALRIFVSTSHSFGASTGQTLAQSPQPVQFVFTKRERWLTLTLKLPTKPLTLSTSALVINWMFLF